MWAILAETGKTGDGAAKGRPGKESVFFGGAGGSLASASSRVVGFNRTLLNAHDTCSNR
jgi:hypothetical protein